MTPLYFTGYAAIFNTPDRAGDILRPAAFAAALAQGPAQFALLWQHDPALAIGRIEAMEADAKGLLIHAVLPCATAASQRAADAVRAGAVGGLSFGYKARETLPGHRRELLAVDLYEISLVSFPMQPEAQLLTISDVPLLPQPVFSLKLEISMYEMKASIFGTALRPAMAGADSRNPATRAFVDHYIRHGHEAGLELKAVQGTSGGAGGYAIPQEIDAQIDAALVAASPIRQIANIVKVGTAGYRKLISTGGVQSGWAAEAAARPETGTPTFREFVPPSGDLYANPSASQAMLDDSVFDLESWLAQEIATEFARAEGSAFVNGSGTSRPKGFLTYTTGTAPDATRDWGTLQYIASGAAGAFASLSGADRLLDLIHSLRAPYRQGACFVMNSATLNAIRKFKTSDGAFLWQPALAQGQMNTLLGYPLVEAEDMPDIAANSLSIAFGNFKVGYLIAERNETQILRDPYSSKPFVHFYATKRIGGGVINSEAIKLLKFAAS